MRSKLHLFVWKLVQEILSTRDKLRKLGINIDEAVPCATKMRKPHIIYSLRVIWLPIFGLFLIPIAQLLLTLVQLLLIGWHIFGFIKIDIINLW